MSCPPADAIADLVEGRLNATELATIERHLDGCSVCSDLVAAAVSSPGAASSATLDLGTRDVPQLRAIPPGTHLGRYEIRRPLGRGGMGEVYEAFDVRLERAVAIKILRGYAGDGRAAQRRLEREAKILARLRSPHVVSALDVGSFEDRVFLVMELVEGPTLAEWLAAERRPWRDIVAMFLEAGEGLAAAHDVGIIHRDFKPQNVLIGVDGKARVSDFGLARPGHMEGEGMGASHGIETEAVVLTSSIGTLTETGALIGTPRYMAPEQLARAPIDARADQFSYCVALYEALYGLHPLDVGRSADSERFQDGALVGTSTPVPAKSEIPRALRALLLRGLAHDPEHRFGSLRELLQALSAATGRRTKRKMAAIGAACGGAAIVAVAVVAIAARKGTTLPGPVRLTPTGTPADWTGAPVKFSVPTQIQCVMPLFDKVVRVMWGTPNTVTDLDLSTGRSKPADLEKESYRYGCPVLSPDGHQLIYEGYDRHGRPQIFYAPNEYGRSAEPIVNSAEPSYDSQPRWLSSTEFLFDLTLQYPAVFSLETRSPTVIPDRDRIGVSLAGFNKTVDLSGRHVAILQTPANWGNLITIYRWPDLAIESQFQVEGEGSQLWRFSADSNLLFGSLAYLVNELVAFDLQRHRLLKLAKVTDRDIRELVPISANAAAVVTRHRSWEITYRDVLGQTHRVPVPDKYAVYSTPSLTDEGALLFAEEGAGTRRTAIFRPSDGTLKYLGSGPHDIIATALPHGEWLVSRTRFAPEDAAVNGVFRCGLRDGQTDCRRISESNPLFQIAASPDGRLFAYQIARHQGVSRQLASTDDGQAVELATGVTTCRLFWSGPHTLWFSRGGATGFTWVEMDVLTRKATGRTGPGSSNCFNGLPDHIHPFVPPAEVVVADDSDIRLIEGHIGPQ